MMRVLVLQGSPRKQGNTATLAHKIVEGLSGVAETDIHEFWLNDMTIHPCQGCFTCLRSGRCVFEDDMQQLYPEFGWADLVVFAVPIYWWHMNAQMKLCFDRMTALLTKDDRLGSLVGKHLVLVVGYNFRHCAQATLSMFEEFKTWIDVRVDVIEYCAHDGPASAAQDKLVKAFDLGRRLAT
jgi:multimeric flavodoxin WrbA